MSHVKAVRDALIAQLGTMSLDAAIVSDWVPEVERDKLTGRELHVAPVSFARKTASRSHKTRTATIGVMLVGPLDQGQESQAAEDAQLLGDQLEALLNIRVGGYSITAIEQPVILDAEEWRTNRKLSTTFILTLEKTSQ